MLLTVTHQPESHTDATVLSHLLHKHPEKVQTFSAPVGDIHVFYPEASPERCTVAVLLEVDPIALVRNKHFRGDSGSLDHYVNDRPYAPSSMLAVALGTVFRTAMTGRSDSHPDVAAGTLALRIEIPVMSARGEEDNLVRRMFEPCGWAVDTEPIVLDPAFETWGDSRYSSVTLTANIQLAEALRQLYVLLPVLDNAKHYWVGDDEIAKLHRAGEGWLPQHPERELITRRYLLHQPSLLNQDAVLGQPTEAARAPGTPLRQQRANAVLSVLNEVNAQRVIDMGCGPGALLLQLAKDRSFTKIVGVDVSARSLEQAASRLRLAEASDSERERIELLHGSTVYRDDRLTGYDAMVLMEVIEHIDPSRLTAMEDAVFAAAAPASVVVTTPNSEYNEFYPSLPPNTFRHSDHRFEWTREEFRIWTDGVAARHGYTVEVRSVGDEDARLGSATQLAIFRREASV